MTFEEACKTIETDREDKYRGFWDYCPLLILRHHIAFKAYRATFITDPEKLREEMVDIANYARKVYERTEAKK